MPILVLVELGAAVQGWHSKSWTSSSREAFITNPSSSREPLSPFNMRVRCFSTFSQVIYVKEPRAGTQSSLAAQAEGGAGG